LTPSLIETYDRMRLGVVRWKDAKRAHCEGW